jgi:hypothetical protein
MVLHQVLNLRSELPKPTPKLPWLLQHLLLVHSLPLTAGVMAQLSWQKIRHSRCLLPIQHFWHSGKYLHLHCQRPLQSVQMAAQQLQSLQAVVVADYLIHIW